jgi:hypothetical protein
MLISSWNKNPKLLTIGMAISFCAILLMYDNYILSQVVSLFESKEVIVKSMEENRGLVLDGLFIGLLLSITYVSFLALIFWNLLRPKKKTSFKSFREYRQSSEFYALVALIFSINFNLGNLREFFFFSDPSFIIFLWGIYFIGKALTLNIGSKIAWLSGFLGILAIFIYELRVSGI